MSVFEGKNNLRRSLSWKSQTLWLNVFHYCIQISLYNKWGNCGSQVMQYWMSVISIFCIFCGPTIQPTNGFPDRNCNPNQLILVYISRGRYSCLHHNSLNTSLLLNLCSCKLVNINNIANFKVCDVLKNITKQFLKKF